MDSKTFEKKAINAVIDYYAETNKKLDEKDIFVVWSCKILQNHKIILNTTKSDDMLFEITYNERKKEMYLAAYKSNAYCIDSLEGEMVLTDEKVEDVKTTEKIENVKTTIDKEFFEKWKDKKVAMHCKTKSQAKRFCELMHENGLTWWTGKSYLEDNDTWQDEKSETVYRFNDGIYDSTYEIPKNYTILEFEDYIVEELE